MRGMLLLVPVVIALSNAGTENGGQDLDKLQGVWTVVAAERNGRTEPEEEFQNDLVTIKKAEMTVARKGSVRNIYRIKLDPAKTPGQIDLIGVTGLDEGKTLRGIYRLEGDRWTLCAGTQQRPTEFKSKEDSTLRLTTLKRKKS